MDLAGIGLLMALPTLVWAVFWSGAGMNAGGRALTGDEWRAKYETPLLQAQASRADEVEAGWVRFETP